jgi:hypothetical protein
MSFVNKAITGLLLIFAIFNVINMQDSSLFIYVVFATTAFVSGVIINGSRFLVKGIGVGIFITMMFVMSLGTDSSATSTPVVFGWLPLAFGIAALPLVTIVRNFLSGGNNDA